MDMQRVKYKVTGLVTNRDLPGDNLIWWYRERCGKSEEVHLVMKLDLAGGRLPSGPVRGQRCVVANHDTVIELPHCHAALGLGGQMD